jgi:hypothetical protein
MTGTSILIDAIVACLLVVTIGFVWRLERRIAVFKREEARFAELLADFAAAAARADQAVKALKATAETAGREVDAAVGRASGLRDDIQYLLDRAGPVADRLSDAVMRSRVRPSAATAAQGPVQPEPQSDPQPESARPRSAPQREPARAATAAAARRAPTQAPAGGVPAGADPADLASLLQTLR